MAEAGEGNGLRDIETMLANMVSAQGAPPTRANMARAQVMAMPIAPGTPPGGDAGPATIAAPRAPVTAQPLPGPPPVPPGVPGQAATVSDPGMATEDGPLDPTLLASLAGAIMYGLNRIGKSSIPMPGAPNTPPLPANSGVALRGPNAVPQLNGPAATAQLAAPPDQLRITDDPAVRSMQPQYPATSKANVGEMSVEGLNQRTMAPAAEPTVPTGRPNAANDATTAVRAQLKQAGVEFSTLSPAWQATLSDPVKAAEIINDPTKARAFRDTLMSMKARVRVPARMAP